MKKENMKIYRPKKLVEGWRIDNQLANQIFVAVPEEKAKKGVEVMFDEGVMKIDGDRLPLRISPYFEDKFGRKEPYRLYYFEWKPDQSQLHII